MSVVHAIGDIFGKREHVRCAVVTKYRSLRFRTFGSCHQLTEGIAEVAFPDVVPLPEVATTDRFGFDFDQFLMDNSFVAPAQPDMGGLEQIWNWENLELDQSWPKDPNES